MHKFCFVNHFCFACEIRLSVCTVVQMLKTFFVVDSEKRLPSDLLESRDSVKYVMFGMFLPCSTILAWKSNRKSYVNCRLALYLCLSCILLAILLLICNNLNESHYLNTPCLEAIYHAYANTHHHSE